MVSSSVINQLNKHRLETDRLVIRVAKRDDLESIYAIHSCDEVNLYLPYETWVNWEDALKWHDRVEHRRSIEDAEQFVIIRKSDQQLIGTCIAFGFNCSDQSCEFGYVLKHDYWRQGYMIEAMQPFVQALLSYSEVQAVRAVVKSDNKSSLKLLSRLNFKVKAKIAGQDEEVSYLRLDAN